MEPLDISNIRDENERNMRDDNDFVDLIANSEMLSLIDEKLDVTYRADNLRMRDGAYVPKPRREEITQEINRILGETGFEEG